MMHLCAFALCLIGFMSLAFAMRRPQRDVIGKPLPSSIKHALRASGTLALLFALRLLVAGKGWGLGLVMFSGHTSLAAGLIYCVLAACADRRHRAAH